MWAIFSNNLLPIFLAASAGFILGRMFQPDPKSVARLMFYIFSPCLIYSSLSTTNLSAGFWQMGAFTLSTTLAKIVLAGVVGYFLHLPRAQLITLVVAVGFANTGNYGLAAVQFAFGESALAQAIIFFTFTTITVYTLGVFIASSGKQSVWRALGQVVTVPAFYAFVLVILTHLTGWELPVFATRTINLLGEAAIPVMLVLLGLQIALVKEWPRANQMAIGAALVIQLIVTPLMALGLARAFGLSGTALQGGVLQAAMPTAVVTTILAVEYDLDHSLMTGVVMLSTLLSPLSLVPLIAYLQG